jgi:hypothetical protein
VLLDEVPDAHRAVIETQLAGDDIDRPLAHETMPRSGPGRG